VGLPVTLRTSQGSAISDMRLPVSEIASATRNPVNAMWRLTGPC
jgi:hypothetical protein